MYKQLYNFDEGKYWISLKKENIQDLVSNSSVKNVTHVSDTGQFISNCFFFLEGIDSEKVTSMLNEILCSTTNKDTLSIIHLKNQDFVASFLFKYVIQNNVCDFDLIIKCLEFLYNISTYLSKKLDLGIELSNNKKSKADENSVTYIPRCSYKFCSYTYFCQFNYPDKPNNNNKGCYSDHYVHNKVAQDVYFLLKYIEKNFDSGNVVMIRSNQEVIKCINTIAYVIKHMYDELWNIYVSSNKQDSYEKFHNNIHK
jgi:hypothetical protein